LKRISAILFIIISALYSSEYLKMFNGVDLTGWSIGGTSKWEVKNGELHGTNPDQNWSTLIFEREVSDYYISFQYKNVEGNSGLYMRGKENEKYNFEGLQAEIDMKNDVALLAVLDSSVYWVHKTGDATEKNIYLPNEFNTMEVRWVGEDVTSWLNGVQIAENLGLVSYEFDKSLNPVASPPHAHAKGRFGIQFHSGKINEMYFKELHLWIPDKIQGCGDSNYVEYNSEVNANVPGDCLTERPVSVLKNKKSKVSFNLRTNILETSSEEKYGVTLVDLKGIQKSYFKGTGKQLTTFNVPAGIYFLNISQQGKNLVRKIFIPR